MSVACDNEKQFRLLFSDKFGNSSLSGKRTYKKIISGHSQSVQTSVDESIQLDDGRHVLLEIDSGNMAKLLAGQYALLNGLYTGDRKNTLFFVIHFYRDSSGRLYSPSRTLKNLNAIQSFDPTAVWLPYGADTIDNIVACIDRCDTVGQFVDCIWI
jgi:hypothetical protein